MGKKWRDKNRQKCRESSRERMRQYRKENPEKMRIIAYKSYLKNKGKYLEYNRGKRMQIRLKVLSHYGNKCTCCGLEDSRFLSLNYINNDGHVWRKTSGYSLVNWIIKNNYPTDIQLLCYNCNMGKAFNGGICPHKIAKVQD